MPWKRAEGLRAFLRGSASIALAMALMNVGTYAFTLAAARILGPREYGAIAAIMGLMLVLNVLSLGLQATAARRVSANPENMAGIEREVVDAGYRSGVVLTVATLVAAPFISDVLRLHSWGSAVLLALSMLPLTVMGAYAGLFQGERRWTPLAMIYLAVGAGRLVFGLTTMVLRPDVLGAMVGVAIGNAVPALIGWWYLRHPDRRAGLPEPATSVEPRSRRSVLGEVAHNSHALLAFFALSNTDVLIARAVLDDHAAGLYAGGLILAKAVLFLPQFVVVIAFPSMVDGKRSRMQRQALGLIFGIGAIATLGAWLLTPLAVLFVGGSAYADLTGTIWAFAGIGTLLAMLQLLVYGTVARQHRSAVAVIWIGLAALISAAFVVGSVGQLLLWVATVQLCVLIALVVLGRHDVDATSAEQVLETQAAH